MESKNCDHLINLMRNCVTFNQGTFRCRKEISDWKKMCDIK